MKRLVMIGLALLAIVGATTVGLTHAGRHEAIATATVTRESFQRTVNADGVLRAVTAMPVMVPEIPFVSFVMKVAWLAPDGIPVKTGDPIVRFDLTDPTKQLRDAEAELAKVETNLHIEELKSHATIADRDASARLARSEADQTMRFAAKDPLLYSRNQITEAELDERVAAATLDVAEHEARSERVLAGTRVELLAIARERAVLAVAHAKTAIAKMEIRAPGDGILVLRRNDRGDIPKLGDQLYSGSTIAEIPRLDVMEAELFVLEVDGGGLDVGQPTTLTVKSRPDRTFAGTVRLVDKLAKQRQWRVPVQYFSVVVALAHTDQDVMKPGQRVRATLVLDREDAIVVPRQAVFEKAGKHLVYRRGDHGFTAQTVELGAATSGRVVIAAGLVVGDVIALRDPMHNGSAEGAP